jgi:hypothetical protein
MKESELCIAGDKVTAWQLPAVLLELVPETALLIAKVAVEACDVLPEEVPDVAESSNDADESAYGEVLAEVGRKLRVELDPYSLAAEIFSPVFQSALDAEQLDEDLIRRCCDFLERAFSGEKYAAEGVLMMVAQNLGLEYTSRILPFAGPKFREALRDSGWLDTRHGRSKIVL